MHVPTHHEGHRGVPVAPAPVAAPVPTTVEAWPAPDQYSPSMPAWPAPAPASSEGGLVKLMGLSRLQHVMHFFQPVRALLGKAGGGARASAAAAHAHHAGAVVAGASAGQRFLQAMGGKLGLLSALLSVPIFWLDWRGAKATLADPGVPDDARRMTKLRLGLSGASAAAGVGALAAAAVGLAFPPALALVGLLAMGSGLAGLGSFVASLFGRHDQHAQGHTGATTGVVASTVPSPAAPLPVSGPAQPTASWTLVSEQLGPLLAMHQEHLGGTSLPHA